MSTERFCAHRRSKGARAPVPGLARGGSRVLPLTAVIHEQLRNPSALHGKYQEHAEYLVRGNQRPAAEIVDACQKAARQFTHPEGPSGDCGVLEQALESGRTGMFLAVSTAVQRSAMTCEEDHVGICWDSVFGIDRVGRSGEAELLDGGDQLSGDLAAPLDVRVQAVCEVSRAQPAGCIDVKHP